MRGHTRKRGKSWSYVIDNGVHPETGKRRQTWVGGHRTRDEAEKALRVALHRVDIGEDPFPERMSFEKFIEQRWLPHLVTIKKPRPSTRQHYEALLRRHALPLIGGLDLAKIRPRHCQAVVDAPTNAGLSPRTAAHLRAALSSAFTAALRWELVTNNPVRATRTPTPAPPALVTPDAKQLLELIDAAVGTQWEIPMLIGATTGARRAETLGLRWSNVDLERGRIKVSESLARIDGELVFVPPKTERAHREIPLPAFALDRLKAHKAAQARRRLKLGADWHDLDLVCERGDGAPFDLDSFTHGFRTIADSIGLEGVRLHDLRHGVATMLAKSGTPAYVTSKVLGHSSVHFTAQTYTHADDESVDRALAGLEAAFGR